MTNIRSEILALLDSIKCPYCERNGETWVLTPELRLYRFSIPQEMTGAELSADLHHWVIANTPPF